MSTIDVKATPVLNLSIDLKSLLMEGELLSYDEDDDTAHYAPDLINGIVKAAAKQIVADCRTELRDTIAAQIREQVSVAITAALEAEVTLTNEWGEKRGEPKPLRTVLSDEAAKQVAAWTKSSRDRYGKSPFEKYMAETVDKAIRADLDEALKQARADIKARMQVAAAKAIADAAAAAVKGI